MTDLIRQSIAGGILVMAISGILIADGSTRGLAAMPAIPFMFIVLCWMANVGGNHDKDNLAD